TAALVADNFEQPARRIDGVIEAEITVGEEHMTAHLSGERGMLLLELALDEGMTGFPHDGAAAVAGDIVVHALRAFDIADDRGAGAFAEDRAGEDNHQLIAPHDSAILVDRADPVGIAVIGDTDFGAA